MLVVIQVLAMEIVWSMSDVCGDSSPNQGDYGVDSEVCVVSIWCLC